MADDVAHFLLQNFRLTSFTAEIVKKKSAYFLSTAKSDQFSLEKGTFTPGNEDRNGETDGDVFQLKNFS